MFSSRIYMPNIFVLTDKDDSCSYLFCNIEGFKFIPLFYNIDDIDRVFADRTIARMGATNTKEIPASKAELFSYGPAKPVIFTTLDRRGVNEAQYYGKKYLDHILLT